jgi:hypothetical protein
MFFGVQTQILIAAVVLALMILYILAGEFKFWRQKRNFWR